MMQIAVSLPGHEYSINIESGALSRLGERIDTIISGRRVLLAVDANIAATHGKVAAKSLQSRGFDVHCHQLVADERHKTITAVHQLCEAMLHAGCDRDSGVIALGGGIVGDVAGFAAASFMRGVPLIQVPTTLLAMVDASIGGKTGVNLPLDNGTLAKNVIGAFWQPRAIFADPQTLATLDDRNYRCGLAECIKHAMIETSAAQFTSPFTPKIRTASPSQSLLDFLTTNINPISSRDETALSELIARSARIKAALVQADERETSGVRALLNLGHTFAHAFESIGALNLLHGEAVAIGLNAAMHCSIATGRLDSSEAQRIRGFMEALGLPARLPRPASMEQVVAAMRYDKKQSGGKLRLVLPRGIGCAELVDDVPHDLIAKALREIGASP